MSAIMDGLIFDFDGVIVDSEPLHYRAFIDVLEPMGLWFDYPTYLQRYVGYDDRDMFRKLMNNRGGLSDARLAELIEEKARAFERAVNRGIAPLPGAVALIEAAADVVPIAIASGALAEDIRLIMPHVGDGRLLEKFSALVTADQVERSKPHPETYRKAAEALDVDPMRCVAIEDTDHGIEAARAARMRVLAVTNTQSAEKLADAHRVVDSLEQIALDDLRALVPART